MSDARRQAVAEAAKKNPEGIPVPATGDEKSEPGPKPLEPPKEVSPTLAETQMLQLEVFEWKMKSHSARVRLSESVVSRHTAELRKVEDEWASYCKTLGIDPTRSFGVNKTGQVSYDPKQEKGR